MGAKEVNQEVMKLREAAKLLVRIAAINEPANMRIGDRMNILEDMRRYLDVAGKGRISRELDRAQHQPKVLETTFHVVGDLVNAAVDGKTIEFEFERGKLRLNGNKLGSRDALSWDGSLRDIMAQFAAIDLADLKAGELGRCAECRKVFVVARRGQRYCNHACAVKIAVRRYQKKHRLKRAQRERERRQSNRLNPAIPSKEDSSE